MDTLQEKLEIKRIEHFALVLLNMKHPTHNKMMYLQDHECISEVTAHTYRMDKDVLLYRYMYVVYFSEHYNRVICNESFEVIKM